MGKNTPQERQESQGFVEQLKTTHVIATQELENPQIHVCLLDRRKFTNIRRPL